MLQVIARLIRPAPPPVVEVAAPTQRPLYEGLTNAEYVALIRTRIATRRAEEDGIRAQMAHVQAERARIAAMKRDNTERETIRSSRFINPKEK